MNAGLGEFLGGGRLGGLHLQEIIEAVEVIKEADGAEELDDFALGVEATEAGHVLVAVLVRVEGHGLGEMDGFFLGLGEESAGLPVVEGGEVFGRPG